MNKQMIGRGRRNEKMGVVVSDKMTKTIRVEIARTIRHAKYGKYLRRSTILMAHDELEQAKMGDTVVIVETRPLSKSKRWKMVEIVKKASEQGAGV
jgi:small subunit ribosomal protein S17